MQKFARSHLVSFRQCKFAYWISGIAAYDGVGRNIPGHYGSGADNGALPIVTPLRTMALKPIHLTLLDCPFAKIYFFGVAWLRSIRTVMCAPRRPW